MVRPITSATSLDTLKREAKRWLAALRDADPAIQQDARKRLDRATPNAPPAPGLRDVQHALAREHGFAGWTPLKAHLASREPEAMSRDARVAMFIQNACPDHHVRGPSAHIRAIHTAERLVRRWPEITQDSFFTRIVCGDIDGVRHTIAENRDVVSEKGGPKGWEPILYLCFTRLHLSAASENAVAIARLLLNAGANPNVHFAAGGSVYTPLVGVIGEGEEDRPPHPRRDELVDLLLEHGANPYDIQVIYNTGFRGRMLWYLRRIHAFTEKQGRAADWADPEWNMIGMGGYGSGARWMLDIAVRDNNLELAEWVLAHGANPNSPPPRSKLMLQRPLYEGALLNGNHAMAELLARYGATGATQLDGLDAFTAAAFRLDAGIVARLAAIHPEYLEEAQPMLSAARLDRVDVTQLLLEAGVSPDVRTDKNYRPLHEAAHANALGVARLLVDRGAEIDARNDVWGGTALGAAAYARHPQMIDLLAPLSRDVWELVPLGHIARVGELLRENPELAKASGGGHTLLMWLPPEDEARAIEIARLLLDHGADPRPTNNDGETAADRAEQQGMFDLAALLRRAAAESGVPS